MRPTRGSWTRRSTGRWRRREAESRKPKVESRNTTRMIGGLFLKNTPQALSIGLRFADRSNSDVGSQAPWNRDPGRPFKGMRTERGASVLARQSRHPKGIESIECCPAHSNSPASSSSSIPAVGHFRPQWLFPSTWRPAMIHRRPDWIPRRPAGRALDHGWLPCQIHLY